MITCFNIYEGTRKAREAVDPAPDFSPIVLLESVESAPVFGNTFISYHIKQINNLVEIMFGTNSSRRT